MKARKELKIVSEFRVGTTFTQRKHCTLDTYGRRQNCNSSAGPEEFKGKKVCFVVVLFIFAIVFLSSTYHF